MAHDTSQRSCLSAMRRRAATTTSSSSEPIHSMMVRGSLGNDTASCMDCSSAIKSPMPQSFTWQDSLTSKKRRSTQGRSRAPNFCTGTRCPSRKNIACNTPLYSDQGGLVKSRRNWYTPADPWYTVSAAHSWRRQCARLRHSSLSMTHLRREAAVGGGGGRTRTNSEQTLPDVAMG